MLDKKYNKYKIGLLAVMILLTLTLSIFMTYYFSPEATSERVLANSLKTLDKGNKALDYSFEKSYFYFSHALQEWEKILAHYPETRTAKKIMSEELIFNSLNLKNLTNKVSELKFKSEAEKDPLRLAQLIAEKFEDIYQAQLTVSINRIIERYIELEDLGEAVELTNELRNILDRYENYLKVAEKAAFLNHEEILNYSVDKAIKELTILMDPKKREYDNGTINTIAFLPTITKLGFGDRVLEYLIASENQIDDFYLTSSMLETIISNLKNIKDLDNIYEHLHFFESAYVKAEALYNLSLRYRQLGDNNKSSELLTEAIKYALNINENVNFLKRHLLAMIAYEYAKLGNYEDAVAIGKHLISDEDKDILYHQIVRGFIHGGFLDLALESSSLIKSPIEQDSALSNIIEKLAERKLFTDAFKMVDLIKDEHLIDGAFGKIASQYLISGDLESAWETINKVKTVFPKTNLMIKLANSHLIEGEQERAVTILFKALEVAKNEKDATAKPLLKIDIAVELSQVGRLKDALEIIQNLDEDRFKLLGRNKIAQNFANQNNPEKALEIIKDMWHGDLKDEVLELVASKYAKDGEIEKAITLANKVKNTSLRYRAYKSIALAYGGLPEEEKAFLWVNLIYDGWMRSAVLSNLANLYAEREEYYSSMKAIQKLDFAWNSTDIFHATESLIKMSRFLHDRKQELDEQTKMVAYEMIKRLFP